MTTFEETLFNAMLPMFERALLVAANTPRVAAATPPAAEVAAEVECTSALPKAA
jgi:hypothetical protein